MEFCHLELHALSRYALDMSKSPGSVFRVLSEQDTAENGRDLPAQLARNCLHLP